MSFASVVNGEDRALLIVRLDPPASFCPGLCCARSNFSEPTQR